MNLKRKEVMSWRKQEKIHFPGGKGHGNLNDWVKNYTALHFYRSVPSTVPMRILLWVIHLFLKSFSGENKHSWFPGIKTKQTILRQLAGQAGHSPGSLWGCPLCLRAWQVSLRRGAHQLLSAMTEARHLRHEWWQSQGFLVGTLLCPAPLAVLCHPTACTESMGQALGPGSQSNTVAISKGLQSPHHHLCCYWQELKPPCTTPFRVRGRISRGSPCVTSCPVVPWPIPRAWLSWQLPAQARINVWAQHPAQCLHLHVLSCNNWGTF